MTDAGRVHELLFEIELDLDNLAHVITALPAECLTQPWAAEARDWIGGLARGDVSTARTSLERAEESGPRVPPAPATPTLAPAIASLVMQIGEALHSWAELPRGGDSATGDGRLGTGYDSPVVLMAGNLTGSGPASQAAFAPGTNHGLAAKLRLDATGQSAVRMLVAVGAACAIGSMIDRERFYWCVIAVFTTFMGANTASEQVGKAANRIVGTVVGIALGSLIAQALGVSTWCLAVVIPAIVIGVYLQPVSFALMTMGISIVLPVLYKQLDEYSRPLLASRVELTAVGAVIAMLAAVAILPADTRQVIRQATVSYLAALHTLLATVRDTLADPSRPASRLTAEARATDDTLMQLLSTARPVSRRPWGSTELRANLGLLAFTAYAGRNLAAAVNRAEALDDSLRDRAHDAIAVELAAIDQLSSTIQHRGPRRAPGRSDRVIVDIARHEAGGVPHPDRSPQRILRALGRIDAALDQLQHNLSGR